MGLLSDLKTLYYITLKPIRGSDHAARLESFYAGQAEEYDNFRRRLLQGRQELYSALTIPEGGIWVDLGGGTGANLEFFGDRIARLQKIYLVDLSHSLLQVANQRIRERGWTNVETVEADATVYQPAAGPVDVVTFSYSLTMIPEWYAALDQARAMLKPGGTIGVVDFYFSRKYPPDGLRRHRWFTRTVLPLWFANDNVFLSTDHIHYLHRHFVPVHFEERTSGIPYVPFVRAPYYTFVGHKRE
jgi:S-adenosylmethionine-diacylgycerolhomoserine-N-methlytransferase